jgi:hypothetical protein
MSLVVSYVYAYLDPISKLPFYIGKGKGRRMYHHLTEAKKEVSKETNLHKIRKIQKILDTGLEPEIIVIDSELTDEDAYELEEFMIGWIGRCDMGTGSLTNMSDGGVGGRGVRLYGENNSSFGKRGENSPIWGRTHTADELNKMHLSQVGKKLTEEHKAALRKPKSEEGRAAIALARKMSLYRTSDETKSKLSESTKGIPKQKIACTHCGMLCAPNTLHRWHMDKCKEINNAF